MRKSLIIPITAVLLLTAVICTAGCVNNTDPVVGNWTAEDDTSVSYVIFDADNTGAFIYGSEKSSSSETESGYSASSSSQTAAVTFNWNVADPKKTYTLTFADGAAETATLDAQRGVMIIDGVVFEKEPSELSGASGVYEESPPGLDVPGLDVQGVYGRPLPGLDVQGADGTPQSAVCEKSLPGVYEEAQSAVHEEAPQGPDGKESEVIPWWWEPQSEPDVQGLDVPGLDVQGLDGIDWSGVHEEAPSGPEREEAQRVVDKEALRVVKTQQVPQSEPDN